MKEIISVSREISDLSEDILNTAFLNWISLYVTLVDALSSASDVFEISHLKSPSKISSCFTTPRPLSHCNFKTTRNRLRRTRHYSPIQIRISFDILKSNTDGMSAYYNHKQNLAKNCIAHNQNLYCVCNMGNFVEFFLLSRQWYGKLLPFDSNMGNSYGPRDPMPNAIRIVNLVLWNSMENFNIR